jgi:3-oxoadipate enol-lactonase
MQSNLLEIGKKGIQKGTEIIRENPVELSFEQIGEGIPLILLHGYPLNRSIWKGVIPFLQDISNVVLPDLRGHGNSPVPEGEYSMETIAGDVTALMDHLKIEKAIIVGHSMGGYVSFALNRYYPERVLGLGLVATQAVSDTPESSKARLETIELIKIKGTGVVTDSMINRLTQERKLDKDLARIIAGTTAQGMIGTLQGIAKREDATPGLVSVAVPTLILSGKMDEIIPREKAQEMADLIPHAWWIEIPQGGHMPMMEDPQTTGIALRSLVIKVIAGKK